jgi:hypothetical protein
LNPPWLPRSEWCIRASGLPRRHTAIIKASATSFAVMLALIDQPTTRRENRSIAPKNVKPTFRCPDVGDVGDPLLVRLNGGELPVQQIQRHVRDRAIAVVLRQTPAP